MPIYEYDCSDCRRRVSVLVRRISDPETPACPRCGGSRLRRLMSRFATVRSEDDRLDAMADPGQFGGVDENDPRSVARFMKKMGDEMGEDLGPDIDEAMESELSAGGGDDSGPGGDAADDL